jgi:hypothetical protein
MKNNFKKGQIVFLYPYDDTTQIEVVGYISKIGRAYLSKKEYIKIKGLKNNSCGDIFSFSMRVYEYDWNKIKVLKDADQKYSDEVKG